MKRVKEWVVETFKGFTLIELLVVVIIIGVLAAIGIPQYTKTIEKARGAEARSGLGHIQEGEKLYYVENEHYYPAGTSVSTATELTDINNALDIGLTHKEWDFIIDASSSEFIAKAKRLNGKCAGRCIYIDSKGDIIGDEPSECKNDTTGTCTCNTTECTASTCECCWGRCNVF